ncbi:type I-B CRISPR-associated protein Cas7/Csh2 [Caloramator sp. ALD01]|uniref:type I-B CRISPR-associated protein Cas7/Csh2 n=1 Tax=Caloramator sp. ALD01 TaxID=1031288 RepID=UPI00041AB35C|nr:type I-B CRISPR-associated protein Cas7/Csh2 [Caloramator sp. ALD01]
MNNNEILYLYDAKLCNPNGDPDEENRPRMDYEREINLVSDLRLKRYIRDYLLDLGYDIFVRGVDGKKVNAEGRTKEFKEFTDEWILNNLIDVRMFGATMPIKGNNKTFIGPVQFNWGYSLNKVELLESSITSHFLSDTGNSQGAIGKDYRVKYSLIAFFGVVSGKRAEKTKLTEEDLQLLDKAMKYAIVNLATRSKVGQYPRLYLRVEYKDSHTILGDFRDYISLNERVENIRDIEEVSLDITKLVAKFVENKDRINKIFYFTDSSLELKVNGSRVDLKEALKDFNLVEVE